MTEGKDITCVFTGSIIDVKYYNERLEEIGISSFWKDEFSSGLIVGMGGVPDSVDLFVDSNNADKAKKCIENLQNKEE
ncbi:putative signal transducing protein [Marinifilum sp. RC60d5]|uniref:putative signal transducing protein n=1 Tax=Marinifilum sp. RC60d5 TaxID=3458414 RepID=UPI0040354CA4